MSATNQPPTPARMVGANPPPPTTGSSHGSGHSSNGDIPQWVNNIGFAARVFFAILDQIFEAAGVALPKTSAKAGAVILRLVDWVLTPVNLAWIGAMTAIRSGATNEWLTLGIVAGTIIGLVMNYINYLMSQGIVKGAVWAKKMTFGFGVLIFFWMVLNLADGIFDAVWPFIVANNTTMITNPGPAGWWTAVKELSFVLQIALFITWALSMFADAFAAYIEYREETSKKEEAEASKAKSNQTQQPQQTYQQPRSNPMPTQQPANYPRVTPGATDFVGTFPGCPAGFAGVWAMPNYEFRGITQAQ